MVRKLQLDFYFYSDFFMLIFRFKKHLFFYLNNRWFVLGVVCLVIISMISLVDVSVAVPLSERFALVVGNSAYKEAPLKNPVNDASDIASVLAKCGFQVTLELDVSLKEMKTAVTRFGEKLRKSGGVGLFYYAGHGMQLKGRNYLIPIGNKIHSASDVEFETLNASRILGKMADADNKLNIVILDACRNNPFARSFRSISSGLAQMDAPKGTLIAYATAPGSVAADGEGRNGIFTKYLLENMQKSGLLIEMVFKNVRVSVLRDTDNKQVPWESSSLTGNFYLNQSGESIHSNKEERPSPSVEKSHGLDMHIDMVGLSGHHLAIATTPNNYSYLFNLTKLNFENDKLPYYAYKNNKQWWKTYSLRGKNKYVLEITNYGVVENYIRVDNDLHGEISIFAFSDWGNILLGTNKGYLFLYDKHGVMHKQFLFDNYPVRNCAVHSNTIAVLFDNSHIVVLKNMEVDCEKFKIISLMK